MNESRNKLIEENLGLVWDVINKEFHGGKFIAGACRCSVEDLYQEGCLGLITAAENFNEDGEVKFSTYAYNYIHGRILTMYRDKNTLVKFSRDAKEISIKIKKTLKEKDINITKELIMEKYKVTDYIAEQTISYMNRKTISIDKPVEGSEGEPVNILDFVVHTKDFSHDVLAKYEFEERLSLLDDFSKKLIELQLQRKKQREISKILGITQPQVSRLTKKAIALIQSKYECTV